MLSDCTFTRVPIELYWEIMEWMDYDSSRNFADYLGIDPLDAFKYHKFEISDSEMTMLDNENVFMICSQVDFFIGNDVNAFNALLANKAFRRLLNDHIILIMACKYGHTKLVQSILKWKNIDPSYKSNLAFFLACESGNIDTVKKLLEDPRVDPSDNENQAIRFASVYGDARLFHILLDDPRVTISPEYPIPAINSKIAI